MLTFGRLTRLSGPLLLVAAAAHGATVFPNNELNILGPLGSPVTTVGVGGGPSAAKDWTQSVVFPGSFLTTELLPSTDDLLAPPDRGNMLRITTNGFSPGGGAGNGVSVLSMGDPLPVGSIGFVDLKIDMPGTFGGLGFTGNFPTGTAFQPEVFFQPLTGWQRYQFSNTAKETGNFQLQITFHPAGTDVGQVSIDHLTFVTAPEPATLATMGAALMFIGAIRRRRKDTGKQPADTGRFAMQQLKHLVYPAARMSKVIVSVIGILVAGVAANGQALPNLFPFPPPQQNLWVDSGSGSLPRL